MLIFIENRVSPDQLASRRKILMSLGNRFADELRTISEELSNFGRTAGERDSCVSDGFAADIAIENNEELMQQAI
ncbi:MAG: hypothetical protein ACI87E_000732 [Mariniblastus sp.]|jgi:hypothetical protein